MPPTAVNVNRIELPRRPDRARAAARVVDPSADFADFVRARLDGPVLRYSQRLELIKEAGRRGIGRFEANLVIAAVLHREGRGQEYELRPEAKWVAPVVTFAAVQGAILAGAWWVFG